MNRRSRIRFRAPDFNLLVSKMSTMLLIDLLVFLLIILQEDEALPRIRKRHCGKVADDRKQLGITSVRPGQQLNVNNHVSETSRPLPPSRPLPLLLNLRIPQLRLQAMPVNPPPPPRVRHMRRV